MAKSAPLIPAWTRTLDAMIAEAVLVKVHCDRCKVYRDVDLAALREKVGGGYSLVNRRCKCRLTPGCKGWNYFLYLHGVMRHLAELDVRNRWLFQSVKRHND